MHRVVRAIEIDAPVERVFDLFSDFESFPRWMRHIRDVRRTGRRFTRWTADAPLGTSVEWEAETVLFEPDRRIAWRSVRGDVDTEGEVVFTETPRRTTLMRVMLAYDPPAGRLGEAVARLLGTDPEQQLAEDLERFAEVAEAGRRGESRQGRERRFIERRDAPADARRQHLREQLERRRMDRRRPEDTRERARHDSGPNQSYARAARRYYREELQLQEERRSQGRQDDRRPYQERGRGERRRADEDYARLHSQRRASHPRSRREEEEDERAGRYPMTPRERELERARRRRDEEYSRAAFRRGVDKLLDQPPSRDWRRWE